jgi:uncharacterized membrane protein
MITFQNEIEIDNGVEKVFPFVADLENIPKWNYYVREVTLTKKMDDIRGSQYRQVRREDQQVLKIVEYLKDELLVIETIPPSKPQLKRRMRFESHNGSTRILDHWELDLGLPGLMEKLAGMKVKSAVKENLGKLKQLMESGQTRLQDGRRVEL